WAHVTADIAATADLRGGVIGEGQLIDCRRYRSREGFAADRAAHLNEADWFRGPALYGFVFAEARPVPFQGCPGSLHFFEGPEGPHQRAPAPAGLLVRVRSGTEGEAARHGGADLIDVKEPRRGPLGRAEREVIADVVRCVAGQRPVSAALGELAELGDLAPLP